ncbi:MAG: DUF5082 domain-containing protein [Bacteroides sp.]|nr:DUF5082 domain-containing protein [Bacteroides sp.]MCM1550439.1 DUF5082 domain-containing protein [Clostridium sp.]
MFETLEELINKRNQTQNQLNSYNNEFRILEEAYERLRSVLGELQTGKEDFYAKCPNENVYISDIPSGAWKGAEWNRFDDERFEVHRESAGSLLTHIGTDIWAIEDRIHEIEQRADSLRSEIRQLENAVAGYNRRINLMKG